MSIVPDRTLDEFDVVTDFGLEEEGLFARDVDGQLIRVEEAAAEDYDKDVHLMIDGRPITVKKAVPMRNSQGEIIRDADGRTLPRATTIYDAAQQVFVKHPGDTNPIPTLCHKEHLRPVGVCRICVVDLYRTTDGKRRSTGKLVAACHHRVEEGMEVQTIVSDNDPPAGQKVRAAVQTLAELLVADHLQAENRGNASVPNELEKLARRLGIEQPRFTGRTYERGLDESSFQIRVDHNSCILCDRCIRACDEVKENHVIGRTGKGYRTTIGFDLNLPMRDSTCVSCGECAINCPTDALTFRPEVVEAQVAKLEIEPGDEVVRAEDLAKLPLFSSIPFKFLQFNGGAVIRKRLKAGDVLCREGEYGNTAFIIESGKFEVFLNTKSSHVRTVKASGLFGLLGRLTTGLVTGGAQSAKQAQTKGIRNDGGALLPAEGRLFKTPDDVILGEMTCLNRYPRSATVVAAEDSLVLEIRRNVLFMLQRNEASRRILDRVYRERALNSHLKGLTLFERLTDEQRDECVKFLKNRIELISVDPGQTIFRQGEPARDFFIVRLGFVKVSQSFGSDERVLNYLGPGAHFGEIGLLSQMGELTSGDASAEWREGTRTATCAALDHVELVRVKASDFRALMEQLPALREALVARAQELLDRDNKARSLLQKSTEEFLRQGLFNAQSLLVLDLESCTRCDECTRACADTHDGVTRLVREGLRFDKFLVASSCRSCLDPYCLVGCPVDAIHRAGDSLEIQIEDHCIGCGLCAGNCPYGNINMHGFSEQRVDPQSKQKIAVVQQKATTCDLCQNIVGRQPSCVYACPHEAAFRMTGAELMRRVGSSAS